jgi:hypothetical protein
MRTLPGRRPGRILPAAALLVAVLAGCTPSSGSSDTRPQPAQGVTGSQVTVPGQGPDGPIPRLVRQVQPSVVSVATGDGEGSGVVSRSGSPSPRPP